MINQREKGFNFYFMRLHYGPYSFNLAAEKARLIAAGFLEEKALKPTRDAQYLIEDFAGLIERNNRFICKINDVNNAYAPLELDYLLEVVHSMPWGRTTIHDLPERTPMLYPMRSNSVRERFELSEKELDDLAMNFEGDLDDATRDVNEGRLLTHEQVFHKL